MADYILDVYLTLVEKTPDKWTRVGPVRRNRKDAIDWLPFTRGYYRGCRVKVKHMRIPVTNGGTTPAIVEKFSRVYNVDLTASDMAKAE